MSEPQSPVPKDAPLMIAWEAYKATDAFTNSRTWVGIPAHTEGSLWAAFVEGWKAAGGSIWRSAGPSAVSPSADLGAIIVRLRRTFGIQREDKQAEMDSIIADLQAVSGVRVEEVCECAKPAPLVPGALCRKCHKWTVARVNEATGELTTIPSRPEASAVELPDIEGVAAAVHEAWMEQKRAKGITSAPSQSTGEEQMRAVYAAIARLRGPTAGSEAPQEKAIEKLEGQWRVRAASLQRSLQPGMHRISQQASDEVLAARADIFLECASELARLRGAPPAP